MKPGGIIRTGNAAIRPGGPEIGQARLKPDYIGENLAAKRIKSFCVAQPMQKLG